MKKHYIVVVLLFLFSIIAGFYLGINLYHIPKADAAIIVSLASMTLTLLAFFGIIGWMNHFNQRSVSPRPQRSSARDHILEKRMKLYHELIIKVKKYQKYYFDLLANPNYNEEKFNEKKSFQKYDEFHKWLKQFHDQNKLFLSKDLSDLIYYYLIAANLSPDDDHHLYTANTIYHQIVQLMSNPRTVKKIQKTHPSWSPAFIKKIGQDPLTFGHLVNELPEKWAKKQLKSDLGQKQNQIALSMMHFIGYLNESHGYKLHSDLDYLKRFNQLLFHLTQLMSNEFNLESIEKEFNMLPRTD